jgi:N-acetylglucosaminyl-diphospho-decaprenol L-rhamnosyltransferase
MTAGHVAVAIVGFRNAGDIVRCLMTLEKSTYTDFEVVICENGGVAAHAVLVERIPGTLPGGQAVTIIQARGNLGYAGGVNVCLRRTPEADAWWVLNPDTEPHPEAMAALLDKLGAGDCDAVGGTLYVAGGRVQSYGGRWNPWLARAVSIGHGTVLDAPVNTAEVEIRQNYLSGASMLVGRRFVQVAGFMREDYFLYCEEVEWCLRGVKRGMRLGFAPSAKVLHAHGTTTGAGSHLAEQPRTPVHLGERNRILLTRDRFPTRLPIAAVAALGILCLRCGRDGAWRQLGYGLAGWWAGVTNRRGAPAWLGG